MLKRLARLRCRRAPSSPPQDQQGERAQEAGVVRADTDLAEVTKLAAGIAKIPVEDPAEIEHILEMALDGLRSRPPAT